MKASTWMVRVIQTININIFVFCSGMWLSAYGATLLDLAEVFRTSVEVISYTLSTRAAGSIFGGIIGGIVFRLFNTQLVIITCVLFIGILLALIPILWNVFFLHATSFTLGCLLTLAEIGSHVWLQVIWKDKSGPQFQLFNLIFGVGGIITPFICEPFLSPKIQSTRPTPDPADSNAFSSLISTATSGSILKIDTFNRTLTTATIATITKATEVLRSESRIDIAYAIIGGVFIFNALSCLFAYSLDSTDPKPDENPGTRQNELPMKTKYIIVTLVAVYMLIGVSDEITLSAYLSTFVVRNEHLRFSKSAGAYLSSVFWISFTASRLLVTILSLKLTPAKLIAFFHAILMVSTVSMLTFVNMSPVAAWLGTVMVAFGLAPYFGNATIWGVQYMVLTHYHMSFIMVSVCLGAMIPGLLIGPLIDSWPMVLMWGHTILATTLTLCGGALLLYGRTSLLRKLEQRKVERRDAREGATAMLNV
ncbi:sodium-dependent glucose transporter 1A-like [Tropilaelaps mercedesae]|uniref:Sodium-dependent glucose transporter 1A-like n=1 Tax=Tropilaelaps mercedesae TaxID=418985 RepID=A0A1V9XVV9_9ACAR|nr:sodium-dependent glucose transporter 1A-like [Tropilaelaps mercedesae]